MATNITLPAPPARMQEMREDLANYDRIRARIAEAMQMLSALRNERAKRSWEGTTIYAVGTKYVIPDDSITAAIADEIEQYVAAQKKALSIIEKRLG